MPTSENAKTIEKMYCDHIRAMSPAERVRNCFAMFQSFYTQASNRYRKDHPGIESVLKHNKVSCAPHTNSENVLK